MSPAERFARNHKLRTDLAIGQAYSHLATDPVASAAFAELLGRVRKCAPSILAASCTGSDHAGIAALVNLSRWSHAYLRKIADWPGAQGPWRVAIDLLVRHLVAKYPVPRFLASAWLLPGSVENERQRGWFVTYAGGCSFRSMDLPIRMTRRMEDIFLRSPDHLEMPVAMRRAELRGLDIEDDLAAGILSTRLATDLRQGDFWRTVWHFFRTNADEIERAQVAPIIDFIYAIRQEEVVTLTPGGESHSAPSCPHFSMKGRTLASLLRLMEDWRHGHAFERGGLSWNRSGLRRMVVEMPQIDASAIPARWKFVELTNSKQLKFEGRALRHCVASYAGRCLRGTCRIWSLRSIRENTVQPIVTLEIEPTKRAIVQARGFGNSYPSEKQLEVIRLWAAREGVSLAIRAAG